MNELDFTLITGGRYTCTPAWSRPRPQYEDCHRIYFPRRGRAQVFCAAQSWTLRPGHVYLIPGHRAIGYHCPRRLELDWLHFRAGRLDVEAALADLEGVVDWPASAWTFWRPVYTRMEELFADPPSRLLWQVHALLAYFLAEVTADRIDAQRRADPDQLRRRLQPALDYMDRHFCAGPPLAQVAAQAHLSPVYFHRRFRELFHVTPHDYMLRRRLQLAWQALRAEGVSVSAAADRAGYSSVFYFSRAFKRYYGYPPRHARHAVRP